MGEDGAGLFNWLENANVLRLIEMEVGFQILSLNSNVVTIR